MEFRPKNNSFQKVQLILSLVALTLVILSVAPLKFIHRQVVLKAASPELAAVYRVEKKAVEVASSGGGDRCDIFSGEWVPNPDAPYYTNSTCSAIHEGQNCMKYGKPDEGYMKWRWKPDGCDLPIFDPFRFLDMMRGKSMAFVGDSVARNHMQSLICLLSRVEVPTVENSGPPDEMNDYFGRWTYLKYNFTIVKFWTTFLVKSEQVETNLFNMYVDEINEKWASKMQEFDYLIISAGHWFFRPSIFYENKRIVGCNGCRIPHIPQLPMVYGYRKAWNTALRAINGIDRQKNMTVFVRTFTPSHFEGGEWNKGGDCVRKRPFGGGEARLDGLSSELYSAQLEEFRAAEKQGMMRLRLLDMTRVMLLRADGHPGKYGHLPDVIMFNDCIHWCLPGPIDSWNDFLFHMLKVGDN